MLTREDLAAINQIVSGVMRQESKHSIAHIGQRDAPHPGQAPYLDYRNISLGRETIRSRLNFDFTLIDTRLRVGPVLFIVESGLDKPLDAQVYGTYREERRDESGLFAIGLAKPIPERSTQAIHVDGDTWFPFMGVRIVARVVPTAGIVSVNAHYQQWIIPTYR